MEYRDVHKTAGEIRAAAYRLSCAVRSTDLHSQAAELHDSICRALPNDPDTPAGVSRSARDLLAACKAVLATEGGSLHTRAEPLRLCREAVAKAVGETVDVN